MFRFKQFSVEDDRASMKVGTDAVLLGATASLNPSHDSPRILDIGTGCGLIALMLAQRFPTARIDAIDIDAPSVEQAKENIAQSPWPQRIHTHHTPLQQYQAQPYHLIVSNPPYFTRSLHSPDPRRTQARHNDSLPLPQLALHARRLLLPQGRFVTILPPQESLTLEQLAGLQPVERIHVVSRPDAPTKRIILTLSPTPSPCTQRTILASDRSLASEFYL